MARKLQTSLMYQLGKKTLKYANWYYYHLGYKYMFLHVTCDVLRAHIMKLT